MLPTKGYFQDIDCPYFDSACGRPYCHFRHKKKHQDSGNDSPKESEIPTYNPTPKSQLANNRTHIPISYVPDLAFRPDRTTRNIQKFNFDKPTYKPTPLSLLSSVNKQVTEIKYDVDVPAQENQQNDGNTTNDQQEAVTDDEYNPANGRTNISVEYIPTNDDKLAAETTCEIEYKPVGENASKLQYNPTSSSEIIDNHPDTHYMPSGESQSHVEYHPSSQLNKEFDANVIDFEDFSNEFDMIDEIISDSSTGVISEVIKNKQSVKDPEKNKSEKHTSSTHKPSSHTESKSKVKPENKSNHEHLKSHSSKQDDKMSKDKYKQHEKERSSKSSHKSKDLKSSHDKKHTSSHKTDSEKDKEKTSESHSSKKYLDKKESKSSSSSHRSHSNKNKSQNNDRIKEKDIRDSETPKKEKEREKEKSHKDKDKSHKDKNKNQDDRTKHENSKQHDVKKYETKIKKEENKKIKHKDESEKESSSDSEDISDRNKSKGDRKKHESSKQHDVKKYETKIKKEENKKMKRKDESEKESSSESEDISDKNENKGDRKKHEHSRQHDTKKHEKKIKKEESKKIKRKDESGEESSLESENINNKNKGDRKKYQNPKQHDVKKYETKIKKEEKKKIKRKDESEEESSSECEDISNKNKNKCDRKKHEHSRQHDVKKYERKIKKDESKKMKRKDESERESSSESEDINDTNKNKHDRKKYEIFKQRNVKKYERKNNKEGSKKIKLMDESEKQNSSESEDISNKNKDDRRKHKHSRQYNVNKYDTKIKKEENKKMQDKDESEKDSISEPDDISMSSGRSSPMLDKLDNMDLDFELNDDEDETLQECYRIFNEYQPPQTITTRPEIVEQKQVIEEKPFTGKKRIAHINAEKVTPKIQPPSVTTALSAAQIMANRLKLARLAQASNEQNNLMNEVKQLSVKRPAPPSLMAVQKNYKMQKILKEAQANQKFKSTSLVDDIITSTQKTNTAVNKFSQNTIVAKFQRRITPATNVLSMQKAKERIEEMRQKTAETLKKTPAQIQKGAKRVAHVPEFSLSDIPDVLQADKSKLPVNVRMRFLTMIAEECVKLYLTKEDAYTRALNEEFSCYEKCKVLVSYKNSSMLAVNRIRKEHQERVTQGLGPIYTGEVSKSDKDSEFKGKKFYENISKYLLSEEDLDIHCYPRESNVPGKAVIKNRKSISSMPLEDYQRKCSRCSKIYVVDEDGLALYEEECLYHPLKKRTLRGEQIFLCCKSNDDIGCVTANTHVSECQDDSDLEGYQTTMEPERDDDPRSTAVYALDCEMCYTTKGLELTRVTIVDTECKIVYDTLVKPLNPIIDYNTRFSGITKEQMDKTGTSILQVQANILHLCNSETILIGHSLESDMKALKIVHGTIVDTSVMFPHRLGLPHKKALRTLASEFLNKIIQNDISGHDSSEDAVTCMELVKYKLKEELKVKGVK